MGFWFGTDLWQLTLQATAALLFVSFGVYLPMRAGVLVLGAEGRCSSAASAPSRRRN